MEGRMGVVPSPRKLSTSPPPGKLRGRSPPLTKFHKTPLGSLTFLNNIKTSSEVK